MKNFLTVLSALASLCIANKTLAQSCMPAETDCAALGYTDNSEDCQFGGIKCPLDNTKMICIDPQCPAGTFEICPSDKKIASTQTVNNKTCYKCTTKKCEDEEGDYFTTPNHDGGRICRYKYTVNKKICYHCAVPSCYGRPYTITCPGDGSYCCTSQYDTSRCSSISGGVGGCTYTSTLY